MEQRVRTGRTHAALVFDADGFAQGWAQYGSASKSCRESHVDGNIKKIHRPPPTGGSRASLSTSIIADVASLERRWRAHLIRSLPRAGVWSRRSPKRPPAGTRRAGSSPARLSNYSSSTTSRESEVGKHAWVRHRTLAPPAPDRHGQERGRVLCRTTRLVARSNRRVPLCSALRSPKTSRVACSAISVKGCRTVVKGGPTHLAICRSS